MTPHIPEEFSTRLIDWSPFVIMATRCRPEILMKTKTKRTRTKRKRTAPTNRRSCASRTTLEHDALDSSLRDVKQDDSNNEVLRHSGEQIGRCSGGVVGAVVGGFESAVWAMLRVRTAVEAAVGKCPHRLFVEEQK